MSYDKSETTFGMQFEEILLIPGLRYTIQKYCFAKNIVLDPNKISGVGTIFGLLVYVLPGPNKQRAFEPIILLS